jgi:hypothetical protein
MALINQLNVVKSGGQVDDPDPFATMVFVGPDLDPAKVKDLNYDWPGTSWDLIANITLDGPDAEISGVSGPNYELSGTSWSQKVGEIFRDIQSSSLNYKDWEINTTNWGVVGPIIPITAKDIESKELNYVGYDLNSTTWGVDGPTIQITSKDIETRELDNQNYELNSTTWV